MVQRFDEQASRAVRLRAEDQAIIVALREEITQLKGQATAGRVMQEAGRHRESLAAQVSRISTLIGCETEKPRALLEARLAEAEAKLCALQTKNSHMVHVIARYRTQFEAEGVEALRAELDDALETNVSLQERVGVLVAHRDASTEIIAQLRDEKAAWEAERAATSATAANAASVAREQQRVAELEAAIAAKDKRATVLQQEIFIQQQRIRQLEKAVKAAAKGGDSQNLITELEAQLANLRTQNDDLRAANLELEAQLLEASRPVVDDDNDDDDDDDDDDELNANIRALQSKVAEVLGTAT